MKKYVCDVCGWVYDEELGAPEHGIAAGTKFEAGCRHTGQTSSCDIGLPSFSSS